MTRLLRSLLLLCMLVVSIGTARPAPADAATTDFDIPNGHFYMQAAQTYGPAPYGFGYAITDEGTDNFGHTVKLWSEFQRLGGVAKLGYPASQRFIWDGFVCQVTQRVVLQWHPETQTVAFVNVFDLASAAGKDDYLLNVRQVPRPAQYNDVGKPFQQVVSERLALLNTRPAIRNAYMSLGQLAIDLNGLPVAPIADMGDAYVLRAQRKVYQEWKKDMPWAKAGQVTEGLGGDIAKEIGLIQQQDPTVTYPVARPQGPQAISVTAQQLSNNPALQEAIDEVIKYDRKTNGGVMDMLARAGVKINFGDTGSDKFIAVYIPSSKTINIAPSMGPLGKPVLIYLVSNMAMLSLRIVLGVSVQTPDECYLNRAHTDIYSAQVWNSIYPGGKANPQNGGEEEANSILFALAKGESSFMAESRDVYKDTCSTVGQ